MESMEIRLAERIIQDYEYMVENMRRARLKFMKSRNVYKIQKIKSYNEELRRNT
jgi:hypothetical protein